MQLWSKCFHWCVLFLCLIPSSSPHLSSGLFEDSGIHLIYWMGIHLRVKIIVYIIMCNLAWACNVAPWIPLMAAGSSVLVSDRVSVYVSWLKSYFEVCSLDYPFSSSFAECKRASFYMCHAPSLGLCRQNLCLLQLSLMHPRQSPNLFSFFFPTFAPNEFARWSNTFINLAEQFTIRCTITSRGCWEKCRDAIISYM